HLPLELTLTRCRHMLPVAATAAPGPGVATRGLDPVRRGSHDLDSVRTAERAAAVLRHPGVHHLTRQGMTDEHDPPLMTSHAEPAVPGCTDLELQYLVEQRSA